jgi:hypothetical protein
MIADSHIFTPDLTHDGGLVFPHVQEVLTMFEEREKEDTRKIGL